MRSASIERPLPQSPFNGRKLPLLIKKEIQEFIIASEALYRSFSNGEPLSCHEAEILKCCMDELTQRRLATRLATH